MSRVYFHTPTRTAELNGSERAHLCNLAAGPAAAAWDLQDAGVDELARVLDLIPEPDPGNYGFNYLHAGLRAAQAAPDFDKLHQLRRSLLTHLHLAQGSFLVAGVTLQILSVHLNTALVASSDLVRLAAKIDGLCEIHGWVDGPDRAWLADLITEGLRAGLYRHGLNVAHDPGGPTRWIAQGWDDVIALLRETDTDPVVMSYSASEQFPNGAIAGAPDDDDAEWWQLDDAERWSRAMAGLRETRPWAQLTPESLAEQWFGLPVSVYDLLAPDRDERVTRAAAQ